MPRKPRHQDLESRILELEKENERLHASSTLPRRVISYPDQFRVLVETLSDALVITNEKGRLKYVNRAFCEMLGHNPEEVIDRPAADFLDKASQAGSYKAMGERRMGQTSRHKETFVAKDGRRIEAIVTGTPIIDENGRFKGSFAVVKDVRGHSKLLEELEGKTRELGDVNVALGVLLSKRDQDKAELEKQVISNVKLLIEPYIEKLEASGLTSTQKGYADILKKNLGQIVSPFSRKLSVTYGLLTPAEIQVANLLKEAKTTKEISALLNLSPRTVSFHRENMRRKLGLKERDKSLSSHLMSLE